MTERDTLTTREVEAIVERESGANGSYALRLAGAAEVAVLVAGDKLVTVARQFGCVEAEAIAGMISRTGRLGLAADVLAEHARDDSSDDDETRQHIGWDFARCQDHLRTSWMADS